MRTRALPLSATSNCCPDDACVIGDALFPLDSLLSIDTGELSEENGVAGGTLHKILLGLKAPPVYGLWTQAPAGRKICGSHDDQTRYGRTTKKGFAKVLRNVPAVRKRQPAPCHACLQCRSIPSVGYGKIPKSKLIRKLEAGDRNIYWEYIAFCNYKGKRHAMLLKRRKSEFALLYVT